MRNPIHFLVLASALGATVLAAQALPPDPNAFHCYHPVTIGWLLGGPVGIGTLVYALLVGPSVQLGFKIFNVQPHKPLAVEVQAEIEGGAE